jgi:hypothetical protein
MSLPKREPAQARGGRAGQQDVAKGGKRPPVEAADRGTAVVVFMVKDEDVCFIRRRHDVADAARNEAGCSS